MRASVAIAALTLLAACGDQRDERMQPKSEDPSDYMSAFDIEDPPGEDVPTIVLPDADGLLIADSGYPAPLMFGLPRKPFEKALARSFESIEAQPANEECGAGPMEFSRVGGLTLNYLDDKFVGWTLENPSPLAERYEGPFGQTFSGITIGMTRSEIEETRELTMIIDSTLGTEFDAGGIGGFFEGEGATVNLLYAGTQCFFR